MSNSARQADLDKLIQESEEAIKRLDTLQNKNKGLPITQRLSRHVAKYGSNLLSVALAGSVLVVAVSRLSDKWSFGKLQQQWEEERSVLIEENRELHRRLKELDVKLESIEEAFSKGSWGLAGRLQPIIGANPQNSLLDRGNIEEIGENEVVPKGQKQTPLDKGKLML